MTNDNSTIIIHKDHIEAHGLSRKVLDSLHSEFDRAAEVHREAVRRHPEVFGESTPTRASDYHAVLRMALATYADQVESMLGA